MGKKAEAIRYAEESRGLNDPGWQIAQACEAILLSSGLLDEAYRRYALEANQGTTNLATFRAIATKYPNKPPAEILRDLISSTPGAEGKWFAAAKSTGLFDVAIELATRSPTRPSHIGPGSPRLLRRAPWLRRRIRTGCLALDFIRTRLRDHGRGCARCLLGGNEGGSRSRH